MTYRETCIWKYFFACLLVSYASTAYAGGFYLSAIGTPGSLGTAGVANPTNTFGADASFTNPAGMTGIQNDVVVGGFQLVLPRIEFDSSFAGAGGDDGGNAGFASAIPSFFAVKTLGEKTRLGFAVTAPMGGGMNYGDDFVGRYGAERVVLAGLAASPSLSYKINDRFSVGGGVSFVYTRFDEAIAINNNAIIPGPGSFPDSRVRIENMDDWGTQPYASVNWDVSKKTLLSVVYRAEMDVDLDGDLNFRNMLIPTPPADEAKLSWDNPQLLEVGLRHKLNDEWFFFANADWEDWSKFSKNQLAFQGGLVDPVVTLDRNWKDTWHAGVALARDLGDHGYSFGISYDSSVVDDEDRTIDLPLDYQLQLSAAYGTESNRIRELDYSIGATLLISGDAEVDQTAQGVRFAGDFDRNIVLFLGGTLRWIF